MKLRCATIDVGNTSTAIGRVSKGRVSHVAHVRGGVREDLAACEDALRRVAEAGALDGVVLGSVVPEVNEGWRRLVRLVCDMELLVVTHRVPMPVSIDYPKPDTIGADRLANACGAVARYGAPAIVADFGTALTFDVVTKSVAYVGGVIAPGLPVMTDYLSEKTALLPRIRLGGACPPVGRSTSGAMRIGAQVGYRGMVREIVEYLGDSVEGDVKLCATGGFARWALSGLEMPFEFDSNLTLYGLACILEHQHTEPEA